MACLDVLLYWVLYMRVRNLHARTQTPMSEQRENARKEKDATYTHTHAEQHTRSCRTHAGSPTIHTFFSLLIAAFSFCSHFLAERFICLETIRKSIKFSSKLTLLPMMIDD
jgi:hypothetical protein